MFNKKHNLHSKIIVTLVYVWLIIFGTISHVFAQDGNQVIYLFYGNGCPHCNQVLEYFEQKNLFDQYPVEQKEIYSNHNNAALYNQLLDNLKIPTSSRGVPLVIMGDQVIIGDKPIIQDFVIEANKYLNRDPASSLSPTPSPTSPPSPTISHPPDLTLAAVIGASLVDAINPCAFAVLIILMTTILATGNSKKALVTGLAFAASIYTSYLLMGLGLYKAIELGGISGIFYHLIGYLAILLGILNLKDYFWYGKFFIMEVPLSWRPKLKQILNSITGPIGALSIGFLVSLILLPCTSGPYIVILGMLANNTTEIRAIWYLILYNLIFVSPMILISYAVYKGYDPKKAENIRQKHLRTLHLIAGLILLCMGIIILSGAL